MPAWICVTCGVQHADTERPPMRCAICEDERQYVRANGQQWTTMTELSRDHAVVLREEEPNLVGVGVDPPFAIGQRALLVRTPGGNVLWDCVSLLDDAALGRIAQLGGISAICMSHPHFYAAHVDFADAFDARILIPQADAAWIRRLSPRVELFQEQVEPVPGLTLARIGGHFDGAAVLHWPGGIRRARCPADWRHCPGRPGPRLGELHVELSQPHPPRRTHRAGRGDAGSPVPF